ncbi:DUF3574 domain-containing protein [Roseomonas sp. GC11]|uniref:DUF3574 domain-containing protein n=1 Tax=Roseomonas sp. GC11 TaxID=2950546 RepID=UPI0021099B65|nr:DUF3574 domain-containing protein [Roseomonas sp. GC11]MCQ4161886.1 DUF3574 domain-containing protein [Roseomonas sp. GC11]
MRAALLLLLLLPGCAACPAGYRPATVAELFLGRATPEGGEVSEAEWRDFLAGTVTPAFPEGLAVQDTAGQWRDTTGRVIRERGWRLTLVLPGQDTATAAARIAPLAEAYTQRFRQESVLRLATPTCSAF